MVAVEAMIYRAANAWVSTAGSGWEGWVSGQGGVGDGYLELVGGIARGRVTYTCCYGDKTAGSIYKPAA